MIQACLSGAGAWTEIKNERLWINKIKIGNNIEENLHKGMIINIGLEGIEVVTNNRILIITTGIFNNKKMDWLGLVNRLQLTEGDIFN